MSRRLFVEREGSHAVMCTASGAGSSRSRMWLNFMSAACSWTHRNNQTCNNDKKCPEKLCFLECESDYYPAKICRMKYCKSATTTKNSQEMFPLKTGFIKKSPSPINVEENVLFTFLSQSHPQNAAAVHQREIS